ncbi:MAG: nucleotidyltransferase [Clostridiales Family XIII bacterium]|jgi:dTDP-glucose pyrophosphorylase|nr:nucleotidyltransferase [Clostridiales Family XIII bacterium]
MNSSPTLIVMAAGMGSRYGGLKQIDPVTDQGEIIIDFSLYDAFMAGFENAVFIIKKEMEADMRALIDDGAGKRLNIKYAFQNLADVPAGFAVPGGRKKPWGTGHAVLAAKRMVDGPFAVINSDDYYGPEAYQIMHEYLTGAPHDERYAMVGYQLINTVTAHGSVARGICRVGADENLDGIDERLKVMWRGDAIAYEDEAGAWVDMPPDQTVSMNFWGFPQRFMDELSDGITDFFENDVPQDPLKAEYLLPRVVDRLLAESKATVKVMASEDRWYGVTYKEDKEQVSAALQSLKDRGLYPDKLWR